MVIAGCYEGRAGKITKVGQICVEVDSNSKLADHVDDEQPSKLQTPSTLSGCALRATGYGFK